MLLDTPGTSRCRSQHVVSVKSSSLFHHSIYLWSICFPWWSIDELEKVHADRTTICFEPWQKPRARLGSVKPVKAPPPQYFNTDHSKTVLLLWFRKVTCSCCPYLYFIRFTARAFRKLLSIYVFSYFPFGFEGRMWNLIVSFPDHCLYFNFVAEVSSSLHYIF